MTCLRRVLRAPLVAGSTAVMLTTVLTSLLGFLFWNVATRSAPPSGVGTATAALALSGTVALLATQGVQPALLVRLPLLAPLEQRALLVASVRASAVLSAAAAVAAVLIVGCGLAVLRQPLVAALVVLTAAVLAVGGVVDAACLAGQRPRGVVVRNAVQASGKLLLLVGALAVFRPVSDAGVAVAVLATAVAAGWASTAGTLAWLHRDLPRHRASWRDVPARVRALSGLGLHHVAALAGQLPALVLPLVVALRLGTQESAYFSVTWMLAGVFFLVSPAVATALLSDGAASPGDLAVRVRRAAWLIAGMLVVPLVVALVFARQVLDLFGSGYGAAGAGLLLGLAFACIPDAVTNLAVSVYRVRGLLLRVAVLNTAMAAAALLLTWALLPSWGIAAAGWSWLLAQGAGSLYVLAAALRARSRARRTPIPVLPVPQPRREVLA